MASTSCAKQPIRERQPSVEGDSSSSTLATLGAFVAKDGQHPGATAATAPVVPVLEQPPAIWDPSVKHASLQFDNASAWV